MEKGFKGEINTYKNEAHPATKDSKDLGHGVSVPRVAVVRRGWPRLRESSCRRGGLECSKHLRKREEKEKEDKPQPACKRKGTYCSDVKDRMFKILFYVLHTKKLLCLLKAYSSWWTELELNFILQSQMLPLWIVSVLQGVSLFGEGEIGHEEEEKSNYNFCSKYCITETQNEL